jgi:hypothetical protein
MKKLLLCLLLTSCAFSPQGREVTIPATTAIAKAQQDVKTITKLPAQSDVWLDLQTQLNTASTNIASVNLTLDKQSTQITSDTLVIAKDKKRIYTDDIIFAVPALILGGVLALKVAKFAALL